MGLCSSNWNHVFNVEAEKKKVTLVLQKYPDVFSLQVGVIKGYEAKIVLKEEKEELVQSSAKLVLFPKH